MKWYFYLHTNGDVIGKSPVVVDSDPEYFNSPFVKRIWDINTDDRTEAWTLAIEALASGARPDRVKEMATKWRLTKEDLKIYLQHNTKPSEEQRKGMTIYLKEILGLDPEEFWQSLVNGEPYEGKLL